MPPILDISIENFTDVSHLADGSNSNILKARRVDTNKIVILKVMKDSSKPQSSIVLKEFDAGLTDA